MFFSSQLLLIVIVPFIVLSTTGAYPSDSSHPRSETTKQGNATLSVSPIVSHGDTEAQGRAILLPAYEPESVLEQRSGGLVCGAFWTVSRISCANRYERRFLCEIGDDHYKTIVVHCPAYTVCVADDQSNKLARCANYRSIYQWYIPTSQGGAYANGRTIFPTDKTIPSKVGNMFYDSGNKLIEINVLQLTGQPNGKNYGTLGGSNIVISDTIPWTEISDLQVILYTGGEGGIHVVTFLLSDDSYLQICVPITIKFELPGSSPNLPAIPKLMDVLLPKKNYTESDESPRAELVGRSGSRGVANSRELVTRGGDRNFEQKNYREIAATSGIVMIRTATGLLGNAAKLWYRNKPKLVGKTWAGDHIFELAIFELWLTFNGGAVGSHIFQCDEVYHRFTSILNSRLNLIGVDAKLNNLKMVLLQKNEPVDWDSYDVGVYNAMLGYLDLVEEGYIRIADALGNALDDVAIALEVPSISQAFVAYALAKFAAAKEKIGRHTHANQGNEGSFTRA